MNRPFWSLRTSASSDDCETIEPLLSLAADGMASPEETRRLDAHLPGCAGCRAALSWMQATRRALASRPVAVPPPDLHSRIALAIAASSAAPVSLRPARVFTLRTAYAAAVSVTVLGIALSYSFQHTPGEVSVHHPSRPVAVASLPRVKTPALPKITKPSRIASNTGKAVVVKHTITARKPVPIAVTQTEHIASREVPTKLPTAPPVVITPVRHTPFSPQVASRDIARTEKQSIEKYLPLPTVKTVAPKLPEGPRVAKIIKEPIRIPLDIQPKVTPDPIVQTASAHQPPAEYDDPLGGLKAQLREKNARVRDVALTAFRAPARGSFHEAMRGVQEIGNTDQTAILGDIHGNQ